VKLDSVSRREAQSNYGGDSLFILATLGHAKSLDTISSALK
jgi:hypothetical protein